MRSAASRRRSTKGIVSTVISDLVVRQSTKSMQLWLVSSPSLIRDTLHVDRPDLMRLPCGWRSHLARLSSVVVRVGAGVDPAARRRVLQEGGAWAIAAPSGIM